MSIPKGRKSLAHQTATLQIGEVAPDFALPEHRSEGTVRLGDWRGKNNVVLVFYPLDWTGV